MDHIWTPWRMEYIRENHEHIGCIFCLAANAEDDLKHLVFYRGEFCYMILNRYPYTSGHVMCVPYVHEAYLQNLTPEIRTEMMALTTRAVEVLRFVYQPDGFNVGLNLGEMAGAGVEDHLHMHIVPRWAGDTNFMTSISATRVMPESLAETFMRVQAEWEKSDSSIT